MSTNYAIARRKALKAVMDGAHAALLSADESSKVAALSAYLLAARLYVEAL